MNKIILLFAVCVLAFSSLSAQSVYLPATHPVYNFLDKMAAKQFITDYRDAVKPLSRETIAKFLMLLDSSETKMSGVERDELQFYKEEFFEELKILNYNNLPEERWHLYHYKSEPSNFVVDLIGGASNNHMADGNVLHNWQNGIFSYGYFGKSLGAYFYYHDNHDGGSYVASLGQDRAALRPLSPLQAAVISNPTSATSYDYDTFNAQLNVDLGFVTLSLEQMNDVWGAGENGNLILSTKAPAFPQIKLRAKLSKDIDFTYIHGWLFSGILDSSRSYNDVQLGTNSIRSIYVPKYIAAQMLEFTPWNGVNIALGESEIYGNRNPELLYLIPVMFFKAAEHYMNDDDNSQFFGSFKFSVVKNYNWYLTCFIDELNPSTIASSTKNHNQVGFTVGGNAYDVLYHDTKINIEYTRINPWVYNHKYPEDTYQNHGVNMGHWLGQNADLFSAVVSYRPIYNLEVGFQFESLRKGGKDSTQYQYLQNEPPLFYGPLTKQQSFGITASYQPLRDFFIDFHAFRTRLSTDITPSTRDFVENLFDYIAEPAYAGKYDVLFTLRYNVY
jgi:hypothetical protein